MATDNHQCAAGLFLVATAFLTVIGCRPLETNDARMLQNEGVALSDVFDSATQRYRFFPGLPESANVQRSKVRVGIIDSGILADHPQIKGLVAAERDFVGDGINDRLGHGTVVALGILGTNYKSSSTVPDLVIAKVASKNLPPTPDRVVEAIDWMADQHAQLVNLSLGFTGRAESFASLKRAIERHPYMLFLAAAGNSGPLVNVYPAAFAKKVPNVVSVASQELTSGKGEIPGQLTPKLISEAEYDFSAGINAARTGHLADAKVRFERVIQSADIKHAAESLAQLALIDIREEKWDAALEHLDRCVKLGGRNAMVLSQVAAVYFNKRDFSSAAAAYQESISLDPKNAQSHEDLGITLMNMSKIDEGIIEFQKAVDLVPSNAAFQANLRQALNEKKLGH